MMDLSDLNKNQLEAVQATQGPLLVIAGAGTGKTTVLTKRIAYLISELGINPNRILAFTFTNKAAEEMRDRINRIIPHSNARWIKTYHSTCLSILKEDIEQLNLGWTNQFSIIDDDDQVSLVKTIIKDHKVQTKVRAKKFVSIIGQIKLNDINFNEHSIYDLIKMFELPDQYEVVNVKTIYQKYQQRLQAGNQLDFSDLINFVHRLFTTNEAVRLKWKERFDYILIDEFQDTNLKQFEIIKCLANDQNNVFAVGDPNQTIYTWRGAYPEIFDDYFQHFKGTKVIKLDLNYRSTAEILKAANNLIVYNRNNFQNTLIPMNRLTSPVNVYIADYLEEEANFVCRTIVDFVKNYGKKYDDILILYRANYCSKSLEEKLIVNQIPYVIFGTVNFYQRKEIKDLVSYLKMIYHPDDMAAMRIINVPRRAIGIETVNEISAWAARHNKSFVNAIYEIEDVDVSDAAKAKVKKFLQLIDRLKLRVESEGFAKAISIIMEELQYKQYLEETETEVVDRLDNIKELEDGINVFLSKHPNGTIIDYLNEISLYTTAEKTRKINEPCVHVMTVHMAKGKEYDTVFVYNFDEGIIPSPSALLEKYGLEEERRIAYVAMTRAINNLIVTCTKDTPWSYRGRAIAPSRFLEEIHYYNEAQSRTKKISDKDIDWYDSRMKTHPFKPDIDLSKVYTNTYQFKVGDIVVHTVFGSGVVTAVNGSLVDIVFKRPYGKKTIVASHNALKRVKS